MQARLFRPSRSTRWCNNEAAKAVAFEQGFPRIFPARTDVGPDDFSDRLRCGVRNAALRDEALPRRCPAAEFLSRGKIRIGPDGARHQRRRLPLAKPIPIE